MSNFRGELPDISAKEALALTHSAKWSYRRPHCRGRKKMLVDVNVSSTQGRVEYLFVQLSMVSRSSDIAIFIVLPTLSIMHRIKHYTV